jgi:uncharacterized protein YegL
MLGLQILQHQSPCYRRALLDIVVRVNSVPPVQPIHAIFVVDTSLSMSGHRLAMVKRSLASICQLLNPRDRVTLIRFSDMADVQLAYVQLDALGLAQVTACIHRLECSRGTNLEMALRVAATTTMIPGHSNEQTMVLLLTDGEATVGARDQATLYAIVQDRGVGAKWFTAGYGTRHNLPLLVSLAQVGKGSYYLIQEDEHVPAAFGHAVGSVMSHMYSHTQLYVTSPMVGALVDGQPYHSTIANGSLVVELGDLASESTKHILVALPVSPDTPPFEVRAHLFALPPLVRPLVDVEVTHIVATGGSSIVIQPVVEAERLRLNAVVLLQQFAQLLPGEDPPESLLVEAAYCLQHLPPDNTPTHYMVVYEALKTALGCSTEAAAMHVANLAYVHMHQQGLAMGRRQEILYSNTLQATMSAAATHLTQTADEDPV